MRKLLVILLILLGLGLIPITTLAQSISPFDIPQARLNGLTLPDGTRYVLILPYNNADALYDLVVQVDLPNGSQLVNAQQTNKVFFNGVIEDEAGVHLFWRAPEILSGDLFAPFAFTLAQPLDAFIPVNVTWKDSLNQLQSAQIVVSPTTLNAVGQGASLNTESIIPAGQFTFIGDTGVVIYSGQDIPASAITIREANIDEDPPAELGDFWWCSGLELQGVSGVTVYVPLRKPLPPLMPLTLFAQVNGAWQISEIQGYVSADGLYAVYDHPGGIIFTGTEAENNPTEAPPAPPPPPDSDGDGFTDDVDSCPTSGNAGFGVDGAGCPLPPPDSDGDGFSDPNDACPNAGDAGFGIGGDGCPLQPPPPPPDSDGDGRLDDADSCPNEGDLGFGIDGDGCPNPPPPDSDGDGIPDFGDTCPTQGDLGLGLNPDGCPVLPPPDSDGDGVVDGADECPNQGDIGFGITDSGCPFLPTLTPTSEIPAPTEPPTATFTATIPPQPTPNLPQLVRFNFTQFTVVFGTTAQAQVEIAEPFPADVRLSVQPLTGASNIPFSAPTEVIIPQGTTSTSFGVSANENRSGFITLQISPVDNPSSILIANVLVQPLELRGVIVDNLPILPAQQTTGRVQMSNPAEFDIAIQLVSNSPDLLVSPVVMPAGATSVDFNITPVSQFTATQAQITASFGDTAIFSTQSVSSPVFELKSQVNYQIVLPTTISTPGDYVGEIVLLDPILPTTTRFVLVTDRSDVVVPAEVVLSAGIQSIPFIFTVVDGGVFNEDVAIRALETITSSTATGTFKLHTLRVQSVTFAEPNITAGLTSSVTVTLNAPVSSGTAEITISLNNADVVPNLPVVDVDAGLYSLQIPQGASTAQFDVTASATLSDDAPVTLQAIFPADVSATTSAQALAGLRIVGFDFGTNPISPNSVIAGTVRLNIPAPTNTEIRFAPADSGTFFFGLPQFIFINAGQTSVNVGIQTPMTTPTSRVGVIAYLASQTPAQGVTGFFTVANVQVTGIELSSPTLAVGQSVTMTVRFSQPLPTRGFVTVSIRDLSGLSTNLVSRTGGGADVGATEAVMQLNVQSNGFSTGIVPDTIPLTITASLGTVIGDGGVNQQTTNLQVVPFMIPESVVSTQSGTVLATTNTMPSLQIRLRGARSTVGGTLQITSSNPEFIIPAEETVQVPANSATITVPLKLINGAFANNSQNITFTVRDANGQNPKTVQITFVKPNVSSLSITQFSSFTGATILEARGSSNGNVTLSCGNPCYFNGLVNGAVTPERTQLLGTNQSFTVSLGGVFPYAAFSADERLTSTIIAQTVDSQRQASFTISPAGIINASLSQSGTGQSAFLAGSISLNSQTIGTVRFTIESSLPSVIPPTFFTYTPPTCGTTSTGSDTRFYSPAFGSFLMWCLDIREETVSVNTPVTITLVATTTSNNISYTSRKSFTVIVSPAGSVSTPTPTNTPITLVGVATPIPNLQNIVPNVNITIATNTPTPTLTPTPTPTPFVLQQAVVVFVQSVPTPAPVTLSISANTTTRRATVSISNTRSSDLTVSLSSSNSQIIGVPSSVTIPRGSRSVSFDYTVNTRFMIVSSTTVRITASGGGDSESVSITVRR